MLIWASEVAERKDRVVLGVRRSGRVLKGVSAEVVLLLPGPLRELRKFWTRSFVCCEPLGKKGYVSLPCS